MILDYIEKEAEFSPLMRIYGSDTEQLINLRVKLDEMIAQRLPIKLTQLFDIVSRDILDVECQISIKDIGMEKIADRKFRWSLTEDSWSIVSELIESVLESDRPCFQWVAGEEARFGLDLSVISVLILNKADGTW